jgi:hypothetical protein
MNMKNLLITGLLLLSGYLGIQLSQARQHLEHRDGRAYMEIQSAYYEGVADGRKGVTNGD